MQVRKIALYFIVRFYHHLPLCFGKAKRKAGLVKLNVVRIVVV